jgi:ATP-dependent Clp protease protease subunit
MKKLVTVLSILAVAGVLLFAFGANAASKTKTVVLTKDNTVTLSTIVDWESQAKVVQKAKELDAHLKSNQPIYLVLDSPGGSIEAGIQMIENLSNLNRPVHTVSMFSASMAFQTVQGLGIRYVTEEGTLMSHKAYGGFRGEFPGQLDSRYSHYLKRVINLDKKVVARTKGKHTLASYHNLIENEYWCDGMDCINQGLADYIVKASCDKSLDGTKTETEKFVFMGMAVEVQIIMSACPLNTGVLDFKVFVENKPLFKDDKEKSATSYYYNDTNISKEELKALKLKIDEIIESRRTRNKTVVKY